MVDSAKVPSAVNEVADSVQPNTQTTVPLFDTSEADAILSGVDPTPDSTVVEASPTTAEQQTEQQSQQQNQLSVTEQIRQELKTQLGIKEESNTDGVEYSQDYITANEKFKDSTGLDFGAAIDQYMQAQVGMGLKDTIETVQQMSSYINQRQTLDAIDQQKIELQSEWGSNFDTYFQLAQDQYSKLSDDLKSKVDALGAEGARMLLAKSLSTGIPNKGVASTPLSQLKSMTSPQRTVTVGQQPMLRHSEIVKMPKDQYYSREVQEALMTGNYIKDIQ